MKALIVPEAGRLELADIPRPEMGPYDALVRIEVCGICNSTDHKLIEGTMFWAPPFPLVLGHESVGLVVDCGAKVRTFKAGDRVTRPIYVPPKGKTAPNPAAGGFAEYGLVRDLPAMLRDGDLSMQNDYAAKRQLIVPRDVSAVDASLAISLGETASVMRQFPDVRGRTVVVAGTGGAGLMFGLWLKFAGARVIMLGRRRQRLEKALALGADVAIDTRDVHWLEQVKFAAHGTIDGMIEASGDAELAGELAKVLSPGGFASAYGVPPTGVKYPAPWREADVQEFLEFGWVVDLVRRGWVRSEDFVTNQWPLADAIKAFAEVGRGEVLKGFISCSNNVQGLTREVEQRKPARKSRSVAVGKEA